MDTDTKLLAEAYAKVSTKNSKSAVEFEHPAQGPHSCSECTHFNENSCELVEGDIESQDWCKLFKAKGVQTEETAGQNIQRRVVALNKVVEQRNNLAYLLDEVLSVLPHKHDWLSPELENKCYDAVFELESEL